MLEKSIFLTRKIWELVDSVPEEIDPERTMSDMANRHLSFNTTVSNLRYCYLTLINMLVSLNVRWSARSLSSSEEASGEETILLSTELLAPGQANELHHPIQPNDTQLPGDGPKDAPPSPKIKDEIQGPGSGGGRASVQVRPVVPRLVCSSPTCRRIAAADSSGTEPATACTGPAAPERMSLRPNSRLAPGFLTNLPRGMKRTCPQHASGSLVRPFQRNVDLSRRAAAPAYVFIPGNKDHPILIPEDEVGGMDFSTVTVPHPKQEETCVVLPTGRDVGETPPVHEIDDSDSD